MPKLPVVSGRKLIRALTRLGFVIVRQKGSHVFLQKGEDTTVVPLHKEIKKATFKKILKQANISLEKLLEKL
jgi:predicted RNA binding protein YcfA (HicA-like mRNA interferase family)